MVDFTDISEPVLNSDIVTILQTNVKGFDYLAWVVYPIAGLIVLILLIVFIVYTIKKINKNSLPKDFKILVVKGIQALKDKDLVLAGNTYNQMKFMSEQTKNKKMIEVSLDFYNKIISFQKGI